MGPATLKKGNKKALLNFICAEQSDCETEADIAEKWLLNVLQEFRWGAHTIQSLGGVHTLLRV